MNYIITVMRVFKFTVSFAMQLTFHVKNYLVLNSSPACIVLPRIQVLLKQGLNLVIDSLQ
jgi:hypothetical protein